MSTEKGERKKIEFKYWKNQKPPESSKLFEDPKFPPNANPLLGLDSNGKSLIAKLIMKSKKY